MNSIDRNASLIRLTEAISKALFLRFQEILLNSFPEYPGSYASADSQNQ